MLKSEVPRMMVIVLSRYITFVECEIRRSTYNAIHSKKTCTQFQRIFNYFFLFFINIYIIKYKTVVVKAYEEYEFYKSAMQ